jgi:hypothetical protein
MQPPDCMWGLASRDTVERRTHNTLDCTIHSDRSNCKAIHNRRILCLIPLQVSVARNTHPLAIAMSMFLRLSRVNARPAVSVTFKFTSGRRLIGSVSAIDSSIFRTLFGTDEIRKVSFYFYYVAQDDRTRLLPIVFPGLRRRSLYPTMC